MYEVAIRALIENEPERAILYIRQEMQKSKASSERFDLNLQESMFEIQRTTDFLNLPISFENAR